MINWKVNISQFFRDLKLETSGPNSIYKREGRALRDSLWREFETLLDETAQRSGSTVASWRIGMMYDTPTEFVELPARSKGDFLQKGSQGPIALARMANVDFKISDMDLRTLALQDIVLTNGSPHFDQAEGGPLRRENAPAGAMERFALRVADIDLLDDFKKGE